MEHPCMHCDKANHEKWKHDWLKCDKPCNKAKQWRKKGLETQFDTRPFIKQVLGIK